MIRLTLHADGESWSLERQAPAAAHVRGTPEPTATWQFVGLPDVPVDETAVTSLLGATAQLNADDLPASPPAQTGLDQPLWQVFLTRRDGRTERLVLRASWWDRTAADIMPAGVMPPRFLLCPG